MSDWKNMFQELQVEAKDQNSLLISVHMGDMMKDEFCLKYIRKFY